MDTPEKEEENDVDRRIAENLSDAETPGAEIAFDPEDAARIAFREEALSDEDARESAIDLESE